MNGYGLRRWREFMGLSQAQAADIIGYGRREYQNKENGSPLRNFVGMACAAHALGMVSGISKGCQIKRWRKAKGISQEKLAELFGFDVRQISMMESGKADIRNGIGLAIEAYDMGIRSYDGPDELKPLGKK